MNRYPHIASMVYNIPLMITPQKLDVIMDVLAARMGVDAPVAGANSGPWVAAKSKRADRMPSPFDGQAGGGNIAVIPVIGTLVQRGGMMDAESGLQSYQSISQMLTTALADPAISTILFEIDSPGGQVAGAFDLARQIFKARDSGKRLVAFANESSFSAAYLLASAAQEIYLPETGSVGSVGVVAVHVDQSGMDAQRGLKYTPVFAGSKKIDGNPHAPLPPGVQQEWQANVDRVYQLFVAAVARYRGLDASAVAATEAGIFDGQSAIDTGLADGVMSWSENINRLASDAVRPKGAKNMNKEEFKSRLTALCGECDPKDVADVFVESGLASAKAMDVLKAEQLATLEADAVRRVESAAAEAVAKAVSVLDLCELAGAQYLPLAKGMIAERLSLDQAREKVLAEKERMDAKTQIMSAIDGVKAGDNPLIAEAKRVKAEYEARQAKRP